MTFMSGGSLGKFINSNRIAFEETIVAWLIDCLSGLEHLIRLKILHSDIKPDNILLDGDNRLKIGDLGLLENIPPTNSKITTVQGSPEYLPSETLLKLKKTEKMGVWSVGVTFFEVITGTLPWNVKETGRKADQRTKSTLNGHNQLRANGLPALRAAFFIPSFELHDILEHHMIVLDEPQRATASQLLSLPYIAQFTANRLATLNRKLYLPADLAAISLAPPTPIQIKAEHEQLKVEHGQLKVERDRLVAELDEEKMKVVEASVCVEELRYMSVKSASSFAQLLAENDLVYIFLPSFIIFFTFDFLF